jgi:hypothetical protein
MSRIYAYTVTKIETLRSHQIQLQEATYCNALVSDYRITPQAGAKKVKVKVSLCMV